METSYISVIHYDDNGALVPAEKPIDPTIIDKQQLGSIVATGGAFSKTIDLGENWKQLFGAWVGFYGVDSTGIALLLQESDDGEDWHANIGQSASGSIVDSGQINRSAMIHARYQRILLTNGSSAEQPATAFLRYGYR